MFVPALKSEALKHSHLGPKRKKTQKRDFSLLRHPYSRFTRPIDPTIDSNPDSTGFPCPGSYPRTGPRVRLLSSYRRRCLHANLCLVESCPTVGPVRHQISYLFPALQTHGPIGFPLSSSSRLAGCLYYLAYFSPLKLISLPKSASTSIFYNHRADKTNPCNFEDL